MSEKKQNGDQQPSVEIKSEVTYHKYIVCDKMEEIEGKFYYKLKLETLKEEKYVFIEVSKIVLAPNMIISISSEKLEDGDILDIEVFDEITCSRLIEKHGKCLYAVNPFTEIIFPDDTKILNDFHSGKVMMEMNDNFDSDASFHLSREGDPTTYEVKLSKEIFIKSINRTFKRIYVSSYGLLNGFTLENLKINPYSLFDCNHNTDYDKPVLLAMYSDRNNILSSKDKWLLKRENWFNTFNEMVYAIMFYGFILFVLVNILATSTYYSFDFSLLVVLVFPLLLIWAQNDKRPSNAVVVPKNKSDIDKSRFFNISRTILGGGIFFFLLYFYSTFYSFNSEYLYDSKEKKFLNNNSVNVGSDLVFRKDKILERYIPIENKYSIDLFYQTPGTLLSASNKYIVLEINFEFQKGNFLLETNLDKALKDIRKILQKNISLGLYGRLSSMNTYNYRVTMIDIERDVMQLLTTYLDSNKIKSEDIVKNVSITTKYAKLHNVDN